MKISGTIRKINWYNADRKYAVFRVMDDKRNMHTVVGTLADPVEGMSVSVEGEQVKDPQYGRQIKATNIIARIPAPKDKAIAYLASGILPGVGMSIAGRLYAAFGEKVFDVMTSQPSRLSQVNGISDKKAKAIAAAWKEARPIHEISKLLADMGIGRELSKRVHSALKPRHSDVVTAIKDNPFILSEVPGIGFRKADEAGRKLGLNLQHDGRILAGLAAVVSEATAEGHTRVPEAELIKRATRLLRIPEQNFRPKLKQLADEGTLKKSTSGKGEIEYAVPKLYWAEYRIAEEIGRLSKGAPILPNKFDIDELVKGAGLSFPPSLKQKKAIATLLANKVSILTGGPGCGKSACMKVVMHAAETANLRMTLMAPTGRAAVRLAEATGRKATTIHTLLGYKGDGRITHHADNRIDTMMVTIDEMSMADVTIMAQLLSALPDHTRLVLVGDPDQLPSVGAGNVLHDLLASGVIPIGRLTEVFRQGEGSGIALGAKDVIAGRMPNFTDDFQWVELDKAGDVAEFVVREAVQTLQQTGDLNSIQVLCPQRRKSEIGADQLNHVIQQFLFQAGSGLKVGAKTYHPNEKVLQTRNNKELNIYNGDIGVVQAVDVARRGIAVAFDTQTVDIDGEDLYALDLAYGITIHKSQGGQFPYVIIPVHSSNSAMLNRNLLYTGMTRGESKVVLVGDRRGLELAISNRMFNERRTGLASMVRNAVLGGLTPEKAPPNARVAVAPSPQRSSPPDAPAHIPVDDTPQALDLFAPTHDSNDPFEHGASEKSARRRKQTFSF